MKACHPHAINVWLSEFLRPSTVASGNLAWAGWLETAIPAWPPVICCSIKRFYTSQGKKKMNIYLPVLSPSFSFLSFLVLSTQLFHSIGLLLPYILFFAYWYVFHSREIVRILSISYTVLTSHYLQPPLQELILVIYSTGYNSSGRILHNFKRSELAKTTLPCNTCIIMCT